MSKSNWSERIKPLSIALILCFFFALLALSSIVFICLWWASDDNEAKLQAIASLLGNALGIIGAVFAVMLAIRAERDNQKEDVNKLRLSIGVSLIQISRDIELASRRLDELIDPNPVTEEARNKRFNMFARYLHFINLSIFESNTTKLHAINGLLPVYASDAIVARNYLNTVIDSIYRNPALGYQYNAADLNHEFSKLVRCIINIGYSLDIRLSDFVMSRYEDPIVRAFREKN
ncbi:MAG: hypothetical protein O9320_01640 [Magnetospirillum sp.]|nr:hypothetical protein [Magnetospirillum sp.]